jgi:hypothetical protein
MRQYLMDGEFFVGAALSTTLTKLALRFIESTDNVKRQNVSSVNKIKDKKYHTVRTFQ